MNIAEANMITNEPKKLEIKENSTIVCFGDSITYGHGADSIETSFPMILQERINIPVINSGVNSDTTADGLKRIERDVLEYNPVIVLVYFGGNDLYYLKKRLSMNKIEKNFKEMIRILDNGDRGIYLIRFFNNQMRFWDFFFRFDRMLGRIQKEYPNIRIIKNIWEGVWGKREYKYDYTHPNSKGYKIIANNIYNEIKDVLEYNNLVK
jgi:lysophospholipase L1-like esterase